MILTSLVIAAISVLAALAVADALRPDGSRSEPATAASTVPTRSTVQEVETAASDLTPREQIEVIGNRWAVLFAAGPLPRACRYETQPLCERLACERVGDGPIPDCTPPSSAFRNSFFGATIQEVEIRSSRAAARFSNGVAVELLGDGGTWSIDRLGGNAGRGFFE